MKIALASFCLLFAVITQAMASDCAYVKQGSFFELGPLKKSDDDYELKVNPLNPTEAPTHTIYFNFCGKSDEQCKLANGKDTKSQAIIVGKEHPEDQSETCKQLTPNVGEMEFKPITEITQGITSSEKGFRLFFNNTATSVAAGDYYNLQIDLYCNENINATDTKFALQSIVKSQEIQTQGQSLRTIVIQAESKYGCPKYQSSFVVLLLSKLTYLYVFLFFVIGLIECFYGNKVLKPTLFFVKIA